MSGSVSIHMVAARAKCSIATVSRVINGTAQTSDAVRGRVEEAIAALGYRPSEIGRSLKTRKTRTVGIVVPSFTNPVFASSIAGVEEVARAYGRSVLLSATEYHSEREEEIVETFLANQVEGLVLTVANADDSVALDRLDAAKVPYVLLYNQPMRTSRYAVTVDNVAGAKDLVRQLIAFGHTRLAFVAGRFQTSDRSLLRYRGCVEAMRDAGLGMPELLEVDYVGDQPEELDALAAELRKLDRPTALVCSNDLLAIAVIAASRKVGMRVPDEVSVAGFDGVAIGKMIEPSLATIEQPTRAMGIRAMEILRALNEGAPVKPGADLLHHRFRPGGSIAAVKTERNGGS